MKSAKYVFAVYLFMILALVSCKSQQATPTSTPIATFDKSAMHEEIPNKLSVFGNHRIRFDNWNLSFQYPEEWNINTLDKYLVYGIDNGFKIEHYDFYVPYDADLEFEFHRLLNSEEKNTYAKDISWANSSLFNVVAIYSPNEIGIDWSSAIGYKLQQDNFQKTTCYVVRSVYESGNYGFQIYLCSDGSLFPQNGPWFFKIIKSVSFEE